MRFEFGCVLSCFRQRCRSLSSRSWLAFPASRRAPQLPKTTPYGMHYDPAALWHCYATPLRRIQAIRLHSLLETAAHSATCRKRAVSWQDASAPFFGRTASMTQSSFQASGAGAWKQHKPLILVGPGNYRRSTLSSDAMSVKKRKSWQSRLGSAARN